MLAQIIQHNLFIILFIERGGLTAYPPAKTSTHLNSFNNTFMPTQEENETTNT